MKWISGLKPRFENQVQTWRWKTWKWKAEFQVCFKKSYVLGLLALCKIPKQKEENIEGSKKKFLNRQKKMLKDIKSTLSASLKSIDVSIRSGSITSLSSGKSFVSNFSVKSDSGISLPAPKPMHVQELSNVQERPEIINLPPRLGT